MRDDILERMRRLRLMIFDVDGVLTDGTLYFSETGAELKAFNARDGHGLKMLKESGVEVAILSARRSHAVDVRAAEHAGLRRNINQSLTVRRDRFR